MAPALCRALVSAIAGLGSPLLKQQTNEPSNDLLYAGIKPASATQTRISPSPAPSPANPDALISALTLAPTEQERLQILVPNPPDISNLTYNFINNTVLPPTGGSIALSSVSVFPALLTTNVAMAIGFVNPCGINTPHSHPRANEFLTVIQNELVTGLILEENPGGAGQIAGKPPVADANGPLPQVGTTLGQYQGTIFPQGSVHFQFNPTCHPSVFAAAFDNRDPGRTQIGKASGFSVLLGPNIR